MDETDETDERNESGRFFHEFFHGRMENVRSNQAQTKKRGTQRKARCPVRLPDRPKIRLFFWSIVAKPAYRLKTCAVFGAILVRFWYESITKNVS